ncbi:hypothetical protein E1193_30845 [Micromonospora sp. KC606]|uniref:hypothetical protein n=1 Tax=Micromonospora sp. KC606 TaxID=2530379 RepID=UPI0010447B94|nr:hypothetical protein [Micromonospora sp. KC606]TDC69022.1 hypothetical protein E1193_30845 [Micromonospora sp. KC606]
MTTSPVASASAPPAAPAVAAAPVGLTVGVARWRYTLDAAIEGPGVRPARDADDGGAASAATPDPAPAAIRLAHAPPADRSADPGVPRTVLPV